MFKSINLFYCGCWIVFFDFHINDGIRYTKSQFSTLRNSSSYVLSANLSHNKVFSRRNVWSFCPLESYPSRINVGSISYDVLQNLQEVHVFLLTANIARWGNFICPPYNLANWISPYTNRSELRNVELFQGKFDSLSINK